jgi:hypothetical protein
MTVARASCSLLLLGTVAYWSVRSGSGGPFNNC